MSISSRREPHTSGSHGGERWLTWLRDFSDRVRTEEDRPRRAMMPMNRREFIAASVAGAAVLQREMKAFASPAGNIQVTVDATKVGAQINPMIFGGYMEPATTQVWAEILTDRKFANAINSAATPPPANPFFRRFFGEPF